MYAACCIYRYATCCKFRAATNDGALYYTHVQGLRKLSCTAGTVRICDKYGDELTNLSTLWLLTCFSSVHFVAVSRCHGMLWSHCAAGQQWRSDRQHHDCRTSPKQYECGNTKLHASLLSAWRRISYTVPVAHLCRGRDGIFIVRSENWTETYKSSHVPIQQLFDSD